MVNDLRDERARLSRRLADIEEELADYGVRAAVAARPARLATTAKQAVSRRAKSARTKAKRAPRGANPKSLKNCILDVLDAKGMRVADIARVVLEGGYQTRAASLDKSVAVACGELVKSKAVKRTGRAYTRQPGRRAEARFRFSPRPYVDRPQSLPLRGLQSDCRRFYRASG